jgi:hypothetical protein
LALAFSAGRSLKTAAKMKNCRWLKPVLVGRFEFVEWTQDRHLRFIGL